MPSTHPLPVEQLTDNLADDMLEAASDNPLAYAYTNRQISEVIDALRRPAPPPDVAKLQFLIGQPVTVVAENLPEQWRADWFNSGTFYIASIEASGDSINYTISDTWPIKRGFHGSSCLTDGFEPNQLAALASQDAPCVDALPCIDEAGEVTPEQWEAVRATPTTAVEPGESEVERIIMRAGQCGRHRRDDCGGCQAAWESNDYRIQTLEARLASLPSRESIVAETVAAIVASLRDGVIALRIPKRVRGC